MSYQIDVDRRLVMTKAWGILTDGDILAHKEGLLNDPAFGPGMSELSDVRAIERLDVTTAGVRAMVNHDTANATRQSGHRLAVVVASDPVFGMARMYQLMGDQEHKVGVFRTIDEARAWLG